ncbi:MAG: PQQ-dependent sugar dehydrogenase [Verrucomicrobiales bacterium]|nr:PQQ-dependent sugar dehydrogenase [Verrucomicrobiales bacterium]
MWFRRFWCFAVFFGGLSASAGGLDVAAPIGPYLDGALPSRTPTASSGDWRLVRAFPNQTFVDPIELLPVPRSNLLMVGEKWGALMIFPEEPDISDRNVVLDLSAQTQAQGDSGLLGVAFHPEYGLEGSPNRDYLYVYYRYTPDPSQTDRAYCRLSRFTWRSGPDPVDPATEYVLINQYDRHNWHNGGGLFFGEDGFLYLSIGDEGGTNDAYNTAQRRDGGLFSGVLRIDVDQNPNRSHPIRRQPVDSSPPPPGWPGSFTQGYYIPDDNPWLSPAGATLEEFFAIGIRSPYRMTIDRPTGRIWLGEVGQSLEEEINLIERGGNYQWPFFEGTAPGPKPRPSTLTGIETAPLLRYGRGEGGCIIGGLVYRGSDHPSLVGKYLFGDFNNGRIRTLDHTPGSTPVVEEIAKLDARTFTSFGTDSRGEILLLTIGQTNLNGGLVYRLELGGEAHPQPPVTLSATGAFADLPTLTPRAGLMPYDLVQALWSDGAEKKRWMAIPNDGTPDTPAEQIGFSENGPWDFPVGSVLVKHFEYGGRRLETRFIVKGEDGRFFGFTYRWRADHSDADLLPGPAVDETIALPGGGNLLWHFPGRVECFECHTDASGVVLGPKTRHLHRDLFYPLTGRTANQIETLNDLGFFRDGPSPASIPGLLAAANVTDASESLERRARSYLDINCSHCHLPGGPTQAQFDLRFTTPPHFQNLINVDPINGLEFVSPRLVKPASPESSIVPFRMGSLDTCCAMPPIAKNAVDVEAVRVVTEWIASLDPEVSPGGRNDAPPPDDVTPPRITLMFPDGNPVGKIFEVGVTASEPVFGLAASDFVVTNGSVLSLNGSGSDYTLTLQPRIAGTMALTLPSDRVVDGAGNANLPLVAPLLFTHTDPAAGSNLLADSDFENGTGLWKIAGDTGFSPLASNGSQSARLTGSAWLSQTVAITGASAWRLSGWSRAVGTAAPGEAIVSFWDTSGRWLAERRLTLPGGGDFDTFTLRVTSPTDTAFATITFFHGGGGSILLDDVRFASSDLGEPPAGPLTVNGDFESGLNAWTTENDVTLSNVAHLGQGAARVGASSSLTHTRSILPGYRLVMTGAAFTEGAPDLARAGVSFWTSQNQLITSRSIPLSPFPTYLDFFFFADIPEAADYLTLWVRNDSNGAVTVDDIGLIYVQATPDPEPPAPDTGFENGSFAPWRAGGTVTISGDAISGAGSARLGSSSSLLATRSAQAGDLWTFRGKYRTTGEWAVSEAGLLFRDRDGTPLAEVTRGLPSTATASEFELSLSAPSRAASVSAWLYHGESGELFLDDLSLVATPAPSAIAPATGSQAATHVRLAAILTNTQLGTRPPDRFTDPDEDSTRPDLTIAAPRGSVVGNDLYEALAIRQVAQLNSGRRKISASFPITWQNDAPLRRDAATLRGSQGNRFFTLGYFTSAPAVENVSAGILTGRHQTPTAAPGGQVTYQALLRKRRAIRAPRFEAAVQASSLFTPAARDAVKMRVR